MDNINRLAAAVLDFADLTCDLPDAGLEKPWAWRDYDEGVRFAFFRTYEDLRTLAVQLAAGRLSAGGGITMKACVLPSSVPTKICAPWLCNWLMGGLRPVMGLPRRSTSWLNTMPAIVTCRPFCLAGRPINWSCRREQKNGRCARL